MRGMAVIQYTVYAAQFARKRGESMVCSESMCFYFCDVVVIYTCVVKKEKLRCRECNK